MPGDGVYVYLTMTAGDRVGESFELLRDAENTIGRGLDCSIVVPDSRCSRVHSIILCQDGKWLLRDNESLNGSYVNDQKTDEAMLVDGCTVRCGNCEFIFHQTAEKPAAFHSRESTDNFTQTLVNDEEVFGGGGPVAMGALEDSPQVRMLLLLYQLSIRQLGVTDADEVLRVSLDLLTEQTGASLSGFLWVTDEGELRPKLIHPAGAEGRVSLSRSLTQKVIEEKRAVWVSNHTASKLTDSLQHFSDALCIPVVQEDQLLGVIHVYKESGTFQPDDFEFAISLTRLTGVSLARAFREQSLQADVDRLKAKSGGFDELIGDSPPMKELKSKIRRLGATSGSVLIRGESGTGKELIARALHRHSKRADRPMISVNCAAIPHDLMESQLFGHKKGAFTSADRDHTGYFQQADGGTLFLDEVGELTLEGQAKLLRILEGHPFLPVGGTEEIEVDVRVIAATNQDLQTYVRNKKFREDLYYRLSVFELFSPPLRDRGEDIALLMDYFLEHFRQQHGRAKLKLAKPSRQKLLGYHWPGNVRQLRNVIDSAVVLAEGDTIEVGDLGLRDAGLRDDELESLKLEDWEQKLIKEALRRTRGSVPEAAQLLGIGRATLYRKIDQYAIER